MWLPQVNEFSWVSSMILMVLMLILSFLSLFWLLYNSTCYYKEFCLSYGDLILTPR